MKAQSKIYYLGHHFNTLEVNTCIGDTSGVHQLASGDELPEDITPFYSLYGHISGEGLECIGDFTTFEAACDVAVKLGGLEKEPVFNDYTKKEFIDFLVETLIPDLKDSGYESIPTDFETAVQFLTV